MPRILVEFSLDENNIFSARVIEAQGKNERSFIKNIKDAFNEEEMKRMKLNAAIFKEEDERIWRFQRVRDDLRSYI